MLRVLARGAAVGFFGGMRRGMVPSPEADIEHIANVFRFWGPADPAELGDEVAPDAAMGGVLMGEAPSCGCRFSVVWTWVDPEGEGDRGKLGGVPSAAARARPIIGEGAMLPRAPVRRAAGAAARRRWAGARRARRRPRARRARRRRRAARGKLRRSACHVLLPRLISPAAPPPTGATATRRGRGYGGAGAAGATVPGSTAPSPPPGTPIRQLTSFRASP